MALVTCKECGAAVSNKAVSCKECGAPMVSDVSLRVVGPDKKFIGAKVTEVFFEEELIGTVEQQPMMPDSMVGLSKKEFVKDFALPSGGTVTFQTNYLGKLRRESLAVPDGSNLLVIIGFKMLGGMDIQVSHTDA